MPHKVIAQKPVDEAEKHTINRHPLAKATRAQIENYVDANVNSMDEAKELLKIILRMIKFNMPDR